MKHIREMGSILGLKHGTGVICQKSAPPPHTHTCCDVRHEREVLHQAAALALGGVGGAQHAPLARVQRARAAHLSREREVRGIRRRTKTVRPGDCDSHTYRYRRQVLFTLLVQAVHSTHLSRLFKLAGHARHHAHARNEG